MKKSVLLPLFALAFCLSCSNDDDSNADPNCESCTALGEKVEICNNGDGTYDVTAGDETQTVSQEDLDLLEVTPKGYVQNICNLANQN